VFYFKFSLNPLTKTIFISSKKFSFMGQKEMERLKKFLDERKIEYELLVHEPVYTSEQAAKARGSELKKGVKALVLKTGEKKLILGLVAADRKIDLNALAMLVGTKKLKLASPEEVLEKTGCEIGSVHPFGNLHNLETYMDKSVLENEVVEFNIGLHTHSIRMKMRDLVNLLNPIIGNFSEKPKS
jgi:Ala-tRNA(Pro) deacylase